MYEIGVETYYKQLKNIYTYSDGADYLSANNTWENNVESGKGKSYGIEISINKNNLMAINYPLKSIEKYSSRNCTKRQCIFLEEYKKKMIKSGNKKQSLPN